MQNKQISVNCWGEYNNSKFKGSLSKASAEPVTNLIFQVHVVVLISFQMPNYPSKADMHVIISIAITIPFQYVNHIT